MVSLIIGFLILVTASVMLGVKITYYVTFDPHLKPIDDPLNVYVGSKKEIKILQYNVFLRPAMLRFGKEEYTKERSSLIAKAISDYDIVSFNEAFHFGSSLVKNLIESVKKYGFNHSATIHKFNFFSRFFVDGGALVLSKYPIVDIDSVVYSSGLKSDALAAKGVIYTKIQISKDKHIHFLSTHMQASYGSDTDKDISVRSDQIRQIVEIMKKHKDNFPIFLLGDMNTDSISNEKEYYRLMNLINLEDYEIFDTLYSTQGIHPTTTTKIRDTETPHKKSIDYIFLFKHRNDNLVENFSTSVEKFEVEGEPFVRLSDHFGVKSVIRLNI